MRRRATVVLLATLLVLTGCATRVPLDQQAAASVQRLGVVTPALPDGPISRIRQSPGMHLGLAGGIADALLELDRNRQLAAALASRGFDLGPRWEQILTDALQRAGFTVLPVAAARPDGLYLERYPAAPVDAFLDVAVRFYGYQVATITQPYVPFAHVRVRLAAPDARVLMEEEFQVGSGHQMGMGPMTFASASGANTFERSGEVARNPDRVVAGVDEALTMIAGLIAQSLRPTPAERPRS